MIGDILQPTHLIFVLVIALLVLGPKRLPEVGRSLGRGLRDFRTALSGEDRGDEIVAAPPTAEPVAAPPTAEPVAPQPTAEPVAPAEPVQHAGQSAP